MFASIISFLGGVLCAAPFIITRIPSMKEHIDKVAGYAGYIGVLLLFWGGWGLVHSITGIGLLSTAPLAWILGTVIAAFDFLAGALLGSGLVMKWTMGNDVRKQELVKSKIAKLTPFQALIGFGEMGMAVVYLLLVALASHA